MEKKTNAKKMIKRFFPLLLLAAVTAALLLSSVSAASLRGDFNEDGSVTSADAVYLLRSIMIGTQYPISQSADVNGDGVSNSADAVYLLRHVLIPGYYPLSEEEKHEEEKAAEEKAVADALERIDREFSGDVNLTGGFPEDLTEDWMTSQMLPVLGLDETVFSVDIDDGAFAEFAADYVEGYGLYTVTLPVVFTGKYASVNASVRVAVQKNVTKALKTYCEPYLIRAGIWDGKLSSDGYFEYSCHRLTETGLCLALAKAIGFPMINSHAVTMEVFVSADEYFDGLVEMVDEAEIGEEVEEYIDVQFIYRYQTEYQSETTFSPVCIEVVVTKTDGSELVPEEQLLSPEGFGDVFDSPVIAFSDLGNAPVYDTASSDILPGDLVVAPDGTVGGAGTADDPMTLEAAKEKLKTVGGEENVTVWMRGGYYFLDSTLSFGSEDRDNVTFRAYNGENAVISGSQPLSGFYETTFNSCPVFALDVGELRFNALFDDDDMLPQPRYPAEGWLEISGKWTPESESFFVDPEALSGLPQGDLSDARVHEVRVWIDERMGIRALDRETGEITVSRDPKFGQWVDWEQSWAFIGEGERFYIDNVGSLLGSIPGQWYLDTDAGILYYAPKAGEKADTLTLYAGAVSRLISIDGCDGIVFEGVELTGTDIDYQESQQAAGYVDSTVYFRNTSGSAVLGCVIHDTSNYAVIFDEDSHFCSISGNNMYDLGAGGIRIAGESTGEGDPRTISDIMIRDNLIHDYGRIFYEGVGILVQYAIGVDIVHNELHDGYYTGISAGWSWGFAPTTTDYINICNNLVYNIAGPEHVLRDGGGIYTLGLQYHSVISGNVLFNCWLDRGIYLDEGSSGITVENNLSFLCDETAMFMHYGSENIIRNNIFGLSLYGIKAARQERPTGMITSGNIIIGVNGNSPYGYSAPGSVVSDGNIVWDYSVSDPVELESDVYLNDPLAYDAKTIYTDPGFADVTAYDFTLRDDSAAVKAGFVSFDPRNAGIPSQYSGREKGKAEAERISAAIDEALSASEYSQCFF